MKLLFLTIGLFAFSFSLDASDTQIVRNGNQAVNGIPATPAVSEADALWRLIDYNAPRERAWAKLEENSPEWWQGWAEERTLLRERGLIFWERFPQDSRRYEWLILTLQTPPFYFSDAKLGAEAYANGTPESAQTNYSAKADWDKRYVALRSEYLAALGYSGPKGIFLRQLEIENRISDAHYASRKGEKIDVSRLACDAFDLEAAALGDSEFEALSLISQLMVLCENDPQAELYIIKGMLQSKRPEILWNANGLSQIANLRTSPLDMRFTALDGTVLDLKQLRGKVVLLDFWGLNCGGCIAALPKIGAVYDKYHDQGFEAIGLCFEEETSKLKVERLATKLYLKWPQSLQGRLSKDNPLANKFGMIGFPTTFLLDKNGLLVSKGLDGKGELEREVRRALGLPVLVNDDRNLEDRHASQ